MLAQASLPVAPGQAQVAAQEVDARLLGHQIPSKRLGVGRSQIGECSVEIVGDPFHRCQPGQGPASCRRAVRSLQRRRVSLPGRRHVAEIVQVVAVERGKRGAVAGRRCQFQAALGQAQGHLGPVLRCLLTSCMKVGAWRLHASRPIEVLGLQNGVAAGEPVGGNSMELAATALEQRPVHRVADEGVREQEPVRVRSDDLVRNHAQARSRSGRGGAGAPPGRNAGPARRQPGAPACRWARAGRDAPERDSAPSRSSDVHGNSPDERRKRPLTTRHPVADEPAPKLPVIIFADFEPGGKSMEVRTARFRSAAVWSHGKQRLRWPSRPFFDQSPR